MICEECLLCYNYMVCENGCYGSTHPCEHLMIDLDVEDISEYDFTEEEIDYTEKFNTIPFY